MKTTKKSVPTASTTDTKKNDASKMTDTATTKKTPTKSSCGCGCGSKK